MTEQAPLVTSLQGDIDGPDALVGVRSREKGKLRNPMWHAHFQAGLSALALLQNQEGLGQLRELCDEWYPEFDGEHRHSIVEIDRGFADVVQRALGRSRLPEGPVTRIARVHALELGLLIQRGCVLVAMLPDRDAAERAVWEHLCLGVRYVAEGGIRHPQWPLPEKLPRPDYDAVAISNGALIPVVQELTPDDIMKIAELCEQVPTEYGMIDIQKAAKEGLREMLEITHERILHSKELSQNPLALGSSDLVLNLAAPS